MTLLARTGLSVGAALLAAVLLSPAWPQAQRVAEGPVRITINAQPIESFEPGNPGRIRFGPLEFRGGLELSSSYKDFGGLSGLRLFPDGERFMLIQRGEREGDRRAFRVVFNWFRELERRVP